VLDLFKKICSIPHCSGETGALADFIVEFARSCSCEVQKDAAGNILARLGSPVLVFQAHYDMVCVGKAPKIELEERDGWLMAKNSSLGADNGIGVAMMLALIEEGKEGEYLFTNDEEIGLVGASCLELPLVAKRLVNIDSEEFGAVYVGCAGGGDVIARRSVEVGEHPGPFWRVEAKGFAGGHSGVDIHKEIPSAILEFGHHFAGCAVARLEAGERRNSIPVRLVATIAGPRPKPHPNFEISPADSAPVARFDLTCLIRAYPHGVRGWEEAFAIPRRSANLAKIALDGGILTVETSVRANRDDELERLLESERAFFELAGFSVEVGGVYGAWEPRITQLAKDVASHYERVTKAPIPFKAIHAGLECAVLVHRYSDLEMVSVGPTIEYPHSARERLRLADIEPLFGLLRSL
jgi:dipeptidase D